MHHLQAHCESCIHAAMAGSPSLKGSVRWVLLTHSMLGQVTCRNCINTDTLPLRYIGTASWSCMWKWTKSYHSPCPLTHINHDPHHKHACKVPMAITHIASMHRTRDRMAEGRTVAWHLTKVLTTMTGRCRWSNPSVKSKPGNIHGVAVSAMFLHAAMPLCM